MRAKSVRSSRLIAALGCAAIGVVLGERPARAEGLLAHDTVEGSAIDVMDLVAPGGKTESVAFTELGKARAPATYTLRMTTAGEDVRIPHCNGRGAVTVDGTLRDKGSKGPLIVHLGGDGLHDVRFDVAVSAYEKRIACASNPGKTRSLLFATARQVRYADRIPSALLKF